jgi:hypothetical protein
MSMMQTTILLDERFSVGGHRAPTAVDYGSLEVNVNGGKVTFEGTRAVLERLVADLTRVLKDTRR